ncbi:hypothetical protein BO82DRAFT_136596 [Aspergillus uvarum CBS 121591]|uniref:Uncharacterized protein n=1 Tax=Aspergillus uvarum CBS 121591 TaxID=1448315 RepID=A0A319C5I8_9EURO|nr:hypothetical protein BO82DRAFT_136596 [Aspergillus uvarum CBS 121591]PYH79217.1 hypothetical protein BO82DRAFT_136596 [Aspergillus uvarum CBS 121591]
MGNFQTVLSSLFWIGIAVTIQYMIRGPLPILLDIISNKMPDILSSLPPSPGWAPFWRSLFRAAPPAFSVWFCVRMSGLSYSIVIALMGYASIGAVDIVGIVWKGYENGWTELLVTECLGQTIVVSMYMAAIFYVLSFRPRRSGYEVEAGPTEKA